MAGCRDKYSGVISPRGRWLIDWLGPFGQQLIDWLVIGIDLPLGHLCAPDDSAPCSRNAPRLSRFGVGRRCEATGQRKRAFRNRSLDLYAVVREEGEVAGPSLF